MTIRLKGFFALYFGCLGLVGTAGSTPAFGYFSAQRPPRHFFNAHLLQPSEYQLAVTGGAYYGLNDTLELGTQMLAYLFDTPIWNLALKHRMFTTEHTLTSFHSHSFVFRTGAETRLLSLHGIVTTTDLGSDHQLSLGLMDGLLMSFAAKEDSSLHLITPVFAWDWVLHSRWAITLILVRPVYAFGQAESAEAGDNSLEVDLTQNLNPTFAMLTSTLAWESFHLEFGGFLLKLDVPEILPYINIFWRLGN